MNENLYCFLESIYTDTDSDTDNMHAGTYCLPRIYVDIMMEFEGIAVFYKCTFRKFLPLVAVA